MEFKDRIVEHPRRIKLTAVSENIYDYEAVTGEVVEAGTPLNAANLNPLRNVIEKVTVNGEQLPVNNLSVDIRTDNISGVDLKIKTVAEKQPPAYETDKAVVEHINGDTITTYGRSSNLFDIKNVYNSGYTGIPLDPLQKNITINGNMATINSLSNANGITYDIIPQINIDYTASCTFGVAPTATHRRFIFLIYCYDINNTKLAESGLINTTYLDDYGGYGSHYIASSATDFSDVDYSLTFKVLDSRVKKIAVKFGYYSSVNQSYITVSEPQVEIGSVATPYEPYAPARRLIETEAGDLYTQYDNGGEWSAKKLAGSGKSGIVYENNFVSKPKWFKVASLPMFSGNTIYTCSLDVQILSPMTVDRINDYGTLNIGIVASNRTISTTQSYMEFSSYGNTLIANNFIIAKDGNYLNIYIKILTQYNKYVVHLNNEYNLSSYGDGKLTLYNNGIPEAVDPVAILTSTLRQY